MRDTKSRGLHAAPQTFLRSGPKTRVAPVARLYIDHNQYDLPMEMLSSIMAHSLAIALWATSRISPDSQASRAVAHASV